MLVSLWNKMFLVDSKITAVEKVKLASEFYKSFIGLVLTPKLIKFKDDFEITAKDYLKAEQYADEKNLTLLGVYHSHPNHPSVPSEHDRVVAQPFFSYVIIAVREHEFIKLQSWRLNEAFQFEEEKVFITQNSFTK